LQEEGIFEKIDVREPIEANIDWIAQIHPYNYIQRILEACKRGPTYLNGGDTVVTKKSYRAAILAVGAVLAAVDDLLKGNSRQNAFCAVRPPGHHAERNTALGFCIFNNIAIGAHYALTYHGLERIFIIDWDVHHGNGTQHIFEHRRDVFYCSLHQWPLYPGTGKADEKGMGDGRGFTLNLPLPPGTGHAEYLQIFSKNVLPAIKKYNPDLIMVSCGFDAHESDPLANLRLTDKTFAELTRLTLEAAQYTTTGKLISVLEGGYNLDTLPQLVKIHLACLSIE